MVPASLYAGKKMLRPGLSAVIRDRSAEASEASTRERRGSNGARRPRRAPAGPSAEQRERDQGERAACAEAARAVPQQHAVVPASSTTPSRSPLTRNTRAVAPSTCADQPGSQPSATTSSPGPPARTRPAPPPARATSAAEERLSAGSTSPRRPPPSPAPRAGCRPRAAWGRAACPAPAPRPAARRSDSTTQAGPIPRRTWNRLTSGVSAACASRTSSLA